MSKSSALVIALLVGLVATASGCVAADTGAASTRTRPVTYVALGASDSVGIGATLPETESWVRVLFERLPPGSRLVNLGVSGALTREAIDQQLPVALDSHPDVVTIWLVVNDFNARVPLDRYSAQLDQLLRELSAGTGAKLAVGNLPDISSIPVYQRVDQTLVRGEVDRWNARIAEVVARNGATLVDLHSTWSELAAHSEYVAADGFHPSTAGHRRLADEFSAVLDQQIDRRQ